MGTLLSNTVTITGEVPGTPAVALSNLTDGFAANGDAIGFTDSRGSADSQYWQQSSNGSTWSNVSGETSSTITLNIGSNVTDNYFLRAASTISGVTVFSNAVYIRNQPAQMSAPTVAEVEQVDGDEVNVTRAAAPSSTLPILSYDLRYDTDSGHGTTTIRTGISSIENVSGLTAATAYYVQTAAVNAAGRGPWSSNGTATTTVAAPTVTGSPISAQEYSRGVAISTLDVSSRFTGTNTYTFALGSDELPTGLSFSSGEITGTPTEATVATDLPNFYVTASNLGGSVTDTTGFTIAVTGPVLQDLSATASQISYTTDVGTGTGYWALADVFAPPTADVIAGSGDDIQTGDSFTISSAGGSQQIDLTSYSGTKYIVLLQVDGDSVQSNTLYQEVTLANSAPLAFGTSGWSVADEGSGGTFTITISTLPNNGGASISDIEYTTDAGANWLTIGGATTGDYDLSTESDGSTSLDDGVQYAVSIRAVNSVGNGAGSGSKSVTPTSATITISSLSTNYEVDPMTASANVTSGGNGVNAFVEIHNSDMYPGRNAGHFTTADLGTLSTGANTNLDVDLSSYAGETVYPFLTIGGVGVSNVIALDPFKVPGTTSPVHIETIFSGTNSAVQSYDATAPAYSTGDLVVIAVGNDKQASLISPIYITDTSDAAQGPNGETINTAQSVFDNGETGTAGTSFSLFWYVATSAETEGAVLRCVSSGQTEQFVVGVSVWDAGTFNASTPISNLVTGSSGSTSTVASPATTATNANGKVVFAAATDFHPISPTPSGWTPLEPTLDVGAITIYMATRTALTTSGGSVASASFPIPLGPEGWAGATFIINPA